MKYFNKILVIIPFLINCGSLQTFPSEMKMDCVTPYGNMNTSVFVDGSIISYSINENMTFILTKHAEYKDDYLLQDCDVKLQKINERIVLTAPGVSCHD